MHFISLEDDSTTTFRICHHHLIFATGSEKRLCRVQKIQKKLLLI